jgi:hypothetical protein
MFDPATTALLRAVLDEVCEEGDVTPEILKRVGREALHQAPSMGR